MGWSMFHQSNLKVSKVVHCRVDEHTIGGNIEVPKVSHGWVDDCILGGNVKVPKVVYSRVDNCTIGGNVKAPKVFCCRVNWWSVGADGAIPRIMSSWVDRCSARKRGKSEGVLAGICKGLVWFFVVLALIYMSWIWFSTHLFWNCLAVVFLYGYQEEMLRVSGSRAELAWDWTPR